MLQILQTRNIESYKNKIEELSLTDSFPSVVEATDNDKVIGVGIYHMDFEKGAVSIDYCEWNDDIMLLDGIIRSILFLVMLRGIEKAVFSNALKNECRKLGFVKDDTLMLDGISGMLDGCKHCKHNSEN